MMLQEVHDFILFIWGWKLCLLSVNTVHLIGFKLQVLHAIRVTPSNQQIWSSLHKSCINILTIKSLTLKNAQVYHQTSLLTDSNQNCMDNHKNILIFLWGASVRKSRFWSYLGVWLCACLCVPAVFPVWRGIGASSGIGWSQGWARCLKWDPNRTDLAARIPVFDYPVWLVLCRGGRARLREVCQRGRGAIRLPADMLSFKLPQLFDIHQVPKVRK